MGYLVDGRSEMGCFNKVVSCEPPPPPPPFVPVAPDPLKPPPPPPIHSTVFEALFQSLGTVQVVVPFNMNTWVAQAGDTQNRQHNNVQNNFFIVER
jgi:hypothetical protein